MHVDKKKVLPTKKRAAVWLKRVAHASWHCPPWLQSIHGIYVYKHTQW